MLGLIEQLEHARAIGIERARSHLVHQLRLSRLAREAGCTTVQHVAGYKRQRRHAALVATTLDIPASLAASIRTGTVTASLIMRRFAAYPRRNGVAAALRELVRLELTLFRLDWISDPALRRETGQELNNGEARNSLVHAVFIHWRDP